MALIEFENEDKYFIKFFLLDASLNLNRWGVTEAALRSNLNSFIGKPFVLTPQFDHPSAVSGDDLMVQQEAYRVGDIIQVGIEKRSGKAWGLAEITNDSAAEILKRGDVNFVSPSIVFDNSDEDYNNGSSIITSFTGAHVAAVKDPAYGVTKAEIKGRCSGNSETCLSQLNKVQASRSSCGKFTTIKSGNKEFVIAANECVERCIKKKVEAGKDLDEQALAICYSECGESNKIKEENTPEPPPNDTEAGLSEDEEYDIQSQSFSKDTSDKHKNIKKSNNMKRKYANDESEKDKVEESEDENKLDLTDKQEEYLKDKESRKSKKSKKAEDEEEKYEREMSKAEDEEKEDAEDEEDDKKDASLRSQVKSLKSELSALKSKIKAAEVEPLIDSILEAKQSFDSNIDARAEYAKLSKLDKSTLEELAGNYKEIVEAKVSPRYQVRYASVEDKSASVDSIIKRLRGGIN